MNGRPAIVLGVFSLALSIALATAAITPAFGSDLRRTAIVRAVREASPAIVNIQGQKTLAPEPKQRGYPSEARRVNGMGTGVVIDRRGYILTNHHVVEGVRRIEVTLSDGRKHVARLVSHDAPTDLAVIKIPADDDLPLIRMGTSSDLMPGEPVVAVGNAYGYEHTVTRGIISALHRTVDVNESQQYHDLIQTDASINPGNSGGPLLNIDGDMIGLNVAVRVGAQGIGFAIPVNKALQVATNLMSVERTSGLWHGIEYQSDRDTSDRDSGTGVFVDAVVQESPAAVGGLVPGDVIASIEGERVARPLDVECALLGRKADQEVRVEVRRNGESVELSMVMAKTPGRRNRTLQADRMWQAIGMRLEVIPAERFRNIKTKYRGGLSVVSVRSGSPASRQGIRAGDVLVGMHIWETISMDNVAYIMNRADFDEFSPVKFYILRGEETLYGHLTVSMRP